MSWVRVEMELEGINSIAVAEEAIREKIPEAKHVYVFAIAAEKLDF